MQLQALQVRARWRTRGGHGGPGRNGVGLLRQGNAIGRAFSPLPKRIKHHTDHVGNFVVLVSIAVVQCCARLRLHKPPPLLATLNSLKLPSKSFAYLSSEIDHLGSTVFINLMAVVVQGPILYLFHFHLSWVFALALAYGIDLCLLMQELDVTSIGSSVIRLEAIRFGIVTSSFPLQTSVSQFELD